MNKIVPFKSIGSLLLGVPKTQIDGILGFVNGKQGKYGPPGVEVAKYRDGITVEYLHGLSAFIGIGILASSQPYHNDFGFSGCDRKRVEWYFKKVDGILYSDYSMLVSGSLGITCYFEDDILMEVGVVSEEYIVQITQEMNVLF
jgi:hypothetical protein